AGRLGADLTWAPTATPRTLMRLATPARHAMPCPPSSTNRAGSRHPHPWTTSPDPPHQESSHTDMPALTQPVRPDMPAALRDLAKPTCQHRTGPPLRHPKPNRSEPSRDAMPTCLSWTTGRATAGACQADMPTPSRLRAHPVRHPDPAPVRTTRRVSACHSDVPPQCSPSPDCPTTLSSSGGSTVHARPL